MEENQSNEEKQMVVFSLSKEEFGVDISEVKEIIRMEEITQIPNTASYIKGVINLRGGIVVVVNLSEKLGFKSKESDSSTRILIVEIGTLTLGMIVDSATEVLRLNSSKIQNTPKMLNSNVNKTFIKGVGILDERMLILLDLKKIFEEDNLEKIAKK